MESGASLDSFRSGRVMKKGDGLLVPSDIEEATTESVTWLTWLAAVGLILGNLCGVVLVALQLPGTWLILFLTSIFAWWRWEDGIIGMWTLVILAALSVLAEVIEFVSGSIGSKKAGGTRRGSWGALIGSIPGAILGSFLIPIPIVGTIVGACIGAATGSVLGDRSAGRDWNQSLKAGGGAAAGTLVGTLLKVGVAIGMWGTSLVALLI